MKNAIIFSCLGFTTSDAFILKNGRQFMVGTIFDTYRDEETYEFDPYSFFAEHYVAQGKFGLTKADIPKPEDVIAEYKRQYAEKGVSINNDIKYAG